MDLIELQALATRRHIEHEGRVLELTRAYPIKERYEAIQKLPPTWVVVEVRGRKLACQAYRNGPSSAVRKPILRFRYKLDGEPVNGRWEDGIDGPDNAVRAFLAGAD